MTAVVTHERGAEPVLDQPGGAVRALKAMSAGAAEGERRIAPAVEEEQGLLAAASRLLDPRDRLGRKPPPARRTLAAQVHGRDVGQPPLAEARGQLEPAIAAGLGV